MLNLFSPQTRSAADVDRPQRAPRDPRGGARDEGLVRGDELRPQTRGVELPHLGGASAETGWGTEWWLEGGGLNVEEDKAE